MSEVQPRPDPDRLIGRLIDGKLEIREHIGTGAMSTVYRAHHRLLHKDVAIKVLIGARWLDPQRVERFAREARSASRLDHPNTVNILDFGQEEDLLYIAMELLNGESLEDVIAREAPMTTRRIRHLMMQVLAALGEAHEKGVIHRDVKPANVMIIKRADDEGELRDFVKVCDFGLAKVRGSRDAVMKNGEPVTQKGAVLGTPYYMSPEQAAGDHLDHRTDIYSCGVMMFEMVTGKPPFDAPSPLGLLMKVINEPMPKPSDLVPEVDPSLEEIIVWAMERRLDDRCPDARSLRKSLKELGRRQDLHENKTLLDIPLLRRSVSGIGVPIVASVESHPSFAEPLPEPETVPTSPVRAASVSPPPVTTVAPPSVGLVDDLVLESVAEDLLETEDIDPSVLELVTESGPGAEARVQDARLEVADVAPRGRAPVDDTIVDGGALRPVTDDLELPEGGPPPIPPDEEDTGDLLIDDQSDVAPDPSERYGDDEVVDP